MRRHPVLASGSRFALLALLALGTSACSGLGQRIRTMRSPVHIALMADGHDARVRTATAGFTIPEQSIGLVSLDLTVQPAEGYGLGFAARAIGGGETAPGFTGAGLLFGSRKIAVEGGLSARTGPDPDDILDPENAYDVVYPMVHLGVRSRMDLGRSPFSVQFRAARHIGTGGEGSNLLGGPDASGWSGETSLSYTARRIPVTANLGYRIEQFSVFNQDQEVTSLYLGFGLLFGRR